MPTKPKRTLEYTIEELESFVKGIKALSLTVRSEGPTFVFAPLTGSIPLIDAAWTVDRKFPVDIVECPPNSSRFENRDELMRTWYSNFLDANYIGHPMKIVCVDEVISGSSALKGYAEFHRALEEFAKKRDDPRIRRKIDYKIAAVGEKPDSGRRNGGLTSLRRTGELKILEVDRILTCDNPDMNPVQLKTTTESGRISYLPEVAQFVATSAYLRLLSDLAKHVGRDPASVNMQNMGKIQESVNRYLKQNTP
jgi:hypothetical protein